MTDRKFCEQCGKEVAYEIVERPETFLVFGKEEVETEVTVTVCAECGSRLYDEKLDDANFRRAYDIYRERHGIPFPEEIRAFRERCGLSQKALGRLLGWGEITVHRYEAGDVPNAAHAEMLRFLLASPMNLLAWIEGKPETPDTQKVRKALADLLPATATLAQVVLSSLLAHAPDEFTGHIAPSLGNLSAMVRYFAEFCRPLTKIKLMKLLFYADFRHFQLQQTPISGMVYAALPYGPALDQWRPLLSALEQQGDIAVTLKTIGNYQGEVVRATRPWSKASLQNTAVAVLEDVCRNLGPLSAAELKDVSHEEAAYQETPPNQPISYAHAAGLRDLETIRRR